jgi:hypothetical protein
MSAAERSADDADDLLPTSQLPTARPLKRQESGFKVGLNDPADATIRELLERFDRGDYLGALAMADATLDDKRVPFVVPSRKELADYELDHREAYLLSVIDGVSPLEAVLVTSGMPLLDALRIFCDLVEKRVVVLR